MKELIEKDLLSLLDSYFEYLQEEICLPSCNTKGCSKNCKSNYELFSKVYNILRSKK
jgi:hypothetical protein